MNANAKIKLANSITALVINFIVACIIEFIISGTTGFRWWFVIMWAVFMAVSQLVFARKKKQPEKTQAKK